MVVVLNDAAKAVVESRLVEVVVGALQASLPPNVAEGSVDMLAAVAEVEGNAVQMLVEQPDLFQVLASRLLGHASERARIGVLRTITALARPPANATTLAQPNTLLQGLAHMLSTGSEVEKNAGAATLSAVTHVGEVCRAVHRTPGLRASITAVATEVAKNGPLIAAANCACVLGHVCAAGDDYFVSLSETLDQMGVVIRMLAQHAVETEAASCFALAAYLSHPSLADAVAKGKVMAGNCRVAHAMVVDSVLKAVESLRAPNRQHAVRCAALLAIRGEEAQTQRTTRMLVAQVQAKGDRETALSALESLALLLNQNSRARLAMAATDNAIDTVIAFMDGGEDDFKERAVQVYGALCLEGGAIATSPGALRSVLALLGAAHPQVQDGAFTALERLSKAPGGKEAMVKFPTITQTLLSRMSDPATQHRAAVIIRNISPSSLHSSALHPSSLSSPPSVSAPQSRVPVPVPVPEEQLWEQGLVAVKSDALVLFVDCQEVGCEVKVMERKGEGVEVVAEAVLESVSTEGILGLVQGEGPEGSEGDAVNAFVDDVFRHEAMGSDHPISSLLHRVAECAVAVLVEDGIQEVPVAVHRAFTDAICERIPPPAPHCTVHAVGPAQRALSELVCANDNASVRVTSTLAADVHALSMCSLDGRFEVEELSQGGHAWTPALRECVGSFDFGTRVLCLDNFTYAVSQLLAKLEESGDDVAMTVRAIKRLCTQFLPLAEARMLMCAPEVDEFIESFDDVHATSALYYLKQLLLHTKFREGTTLSVANESQGISWVRGFMSTLPAPAPPSPDLVRKSSLARKRSSQHAAHLPSNGSGGGATPASERARKRASRQKPRLNVEGSEEEWAQALRGLLRNANTPDRRQQAIATASAFASHPSIAVKVVEGIGLEAFVEASQSSDAEVRFGCVSLLHCYVAADGVGHVHSLDAVIDILAQVLEHPQEDKISVEALESVLELLARDETRERVRAHSSALSVCIERMSSASERECEAACEVLATAVEVAGANSLAQHATTLLEACCHVLTHEPLFPSCVDLAASCVKHALSCQPSPPSPPSLPAALNVLLRSSATDTTKRDGLESVRAMLQAQQGECRQGLVHGSVHASVLGLVEEGQVPAPGIALALEVLELFGGEDGLKEDVGAVPRVWEYIGHVLSSNHPEAMAHALGVASIAASSETSRSIVSQLFNDPSPNAPMGAVFRGLVVVLCDDAHPARRAGLQAMCVLSANHVVSRAVFGGELAVREGLASQLRRGGQEAEQGGQVVMHLCSAPENQAKFAATPSILSGLPMLAQATPLGAELAGGSIALLTHCQDAHRTIGTHSGVVDMLVELGATRGAEREKARDYGLRAIANLLVDEDNQLDFFQHSDLLSVLTCASSLQSTTAQEACATALTFLVANPNNQQHIADHPDVVSALVVLARDGSQNAQEDAIVGLGAICEVPAMQESIAQQDGAIGAVLRMLMSDEPTISMAASWLLANLAKSEVNQILISDEEGVFDVLAACIASDREEALRENCVVAVAHLTCDLDNQLTVSQHQSLMTAVVGALHQPINDTATSHALLVLSHICSSRANSLAFLQLPGCVDVLVGCLFSESPVLQESAGRVTMLLAKDNEARPLLIETDGFLEGLAALIASHRPKAVDLGHRTILYSMPDRNSLRAIAAHPGVVHALQGTEYALKLTPKLKSASRDLLARMGVPPKLLAAARRQSRR